ncbi:InlB B-repeat-containing protein [bacterium]|nr:InlB B-repeat-containing protein [bacterium]
MPITPETGLLITAQWTINSHTLTFDFDNGDPRSIKTLEYGTPIEIPEIPLKKGHKFSGWSEEIPATMPAHDVTITAQYRTNIHTITFDTKGGTPIAPITTGFDYDITAPADPTKPGYTFLGWDKEIPDTMPDADMTITANWDINQYTLTLKLDNGEEDIVITGVYHSAISAQPDPQREGHTFKGWSKTIPTEMQAEDMIITANWEINKNTLTFNLDNGDDPIVSILNFGDTITVPENFSRTGYTFSGWNKDIPATMPDTGLVITALWNVNQYTFTFDTDGGTPIDPIVKDYREVVTKPADPTKTGYTFSGWDKTIPAKMPAHDDTFTVQWKMNQYVISFDADGGTPVEAITADYNSGIIAPANPTKTGYLFSGWMPALPQKMPGYNIDVIAQWTPIKYTLTFDTDGGTPVEAITADYNSGIIAPENPTKTGYIFSGWMPTIPEKMPLNGLTVKADWIVDTETPYLVEHQKEELNGTYSISEVFTGKGETNGKVTPEVKTYEGFISPSSEEITIKPDGSTKLIYKYARKEIVLHFDTDGGSNISDKTGKYGAVVTVSDPTKRGYHFSGWMPEIPSHFPAENETYTAKWNAKSYSIDYDLDEGMYGESYPTVAKYDEKIIIDNPTKTGYLFKGWKITGMDQGEHYYGDATTNDSMINETTETEFKNLTATERGRVSFKALWIPRTDIHYTVNHHREKLDEGYNTEVEILTGTVNGITNAQKKIYS